MNKLKIKWYDFYTYLLERVICFLMNRHEKQLKKWQKVLETADNKTSREIFQLGRDEMLQEIFSNFVKMPDDVFADWLIEIHEKRGL